MVVEDYIRIIPGRPIDGVHYHHIEILDPLDGGWHSIRSCAEKSDAVKVCNKLTRLLNHAHNARGHARNR